MPLTANATTNSKVNCNWHSATTLWIWDSVFDILFFFQKKSALTQRCSAPFFFVLRELVFSGEQFRGWLFFAPGKGTFKAEQPWNSAVRRLRFSGNVQLIQFWFSSEQLCLFMNKFWTALVSREISARECLWTRRNSMHEQNQQCLRLIMFPRIWASSQQHKQNTWMPGFWRVPE